MSGLKSIDEEWEEYARRTLGGIPKVSEQYRQTKAAFFAGMLVVLDAARAIGCPEVPEEVGEEWFKKAHADCVGFWQRWVAFINGTLN